MPVVLTVPKRLLVIASAVIVAVVVLAVAWPTMVASPSSARSVSISSTTSMTSDTASGTSTISGLPLNHAIYVLIPFGVGDNESMNFQPLSVTVVIGVNNTIIWNDLDASQHTVTSDFVPSGATKFGSGILNQGQTYTVTLTVPGTYRYYCTIHPTWMRGTIVVKQ